MKRLNEGNQSKIIAKWIGKDKEFKRGCLALLKKRI